MSTENFFVYLSTLSNSKLKINFWITFLNKVESLKTKFLYNAFQSCDENSLKPQKVTKTREKWRIVESVNEKLLSFWHSSQFTTELESLIMCCGFASLKLISLALVIRACSLNVLLYFYFLVSENRKSGITIAILLGCQFYVIFSMVASCKLLYGLVKVNSLS